MGGIFGDFFDLNRDGNMDPFEHSLEWYVLMGGLSDSEEIDEFESEDEDGFEDEYDYEDEDEEEQGYDFGIESASFARRMEEAARNFTHIEKGGSIDEYVAAVTRSFLYLAHADNDEKNYSRLVAWVEEWMGE